jgi:hypothetical protein
VVIDFSPDLVLDCGNAGRWGKRGARGVDGETVSPALEHRLLDRRDRVGHGRQLLCHQLCGVGGERGFQGFAVSDEVAGEFFAKNSGKLVGGGE